VACEGTQPTRGLHRNSQVYFLQNFVIEPTILQTGDSIEKVVHRVFVDLRLHHASLPVPSVLTQPTKGDKVGTAGTKRASVNLLQMATASQVTVQAGQCAELGVTNITFIGSSAP
jgi:hypothetical protein